MENNKDNLKLIFYAANEEKSETPSKWKVYLEKIKYIIKGLKEEQRQEQARAIDIEYMTDSSAAMLQGVPLIYHTILIAGSTFLMIALIWANFAILDVVTVAQGKVIPSKNMQVVQNLERGNCQRD